MHPGRPHSARTTHVRPRGCHGFNGVARTDCHWACEQLRRSPLPVRPSRWGLSGTQRSEISVGVSTPTSRLSPVPAMTSPRSSGAAWRHRHQPEAQRCVRRVGCVSRPATPTGRQGLKALRLAPAPPGHWCQPTSGVPITSVFGPRCWGIQASPDIASPITIPVHATVLAVDPATSVGHWVRLFHRACGVTANGHISRCSVPGGQSVQAGQPITFDHSRRIASILLMVGVLSGRTPVRPIAFRNQPGWAFQ